MDLKISQAELLAGLEGLNSAVERRDTIPVLSCAKLIAEKEPEQISVLGTDLELGLKLKLSAQVKESGQVALPLRRILDVVRSLPASAQVRLSLRANSWLRLECEAYEFDLLALDGREFPSLPTSHSDLSRYQAVRGERLEQMIAHVLSAIPQEAGLQAIPGALFETDDRGTSRLVATDLYRLAIAEEELQLDPPKTHGAVVISRKGLLELRKLAAGNAKTFRLAWDTGVLYARTERAELFVRLLDHEFVDYRRIVPGHLGQCFKAGRERLLAAVRTVSLLCNDRHRAVRFKLESGALALQTSSAESGEARAALEVVYTGDPLEFGFHHRYLLDYLSASPAEELEIFFEDSKKPFLFKDTQGAYYIMPARV